VSQITDQFRLPGAASCVASSRSMRSLWSIGRSSSSSAACGSSTGVTTCSQGAGAPDRWNEDQVLISEAALSANRLNQQGPREPESAEKVREKAGRGCFCGCCEQGFRRRVDVPTSKARSRSNHGGGEPVQARRDCRIHGPDPNLGPDGRGAGRPCASQGSARPLAGAKLPES